MTTPILSDTVLITLFVSIFICICAIAFLAVKANLRMTGLEDSIKKPKENHRPAMKGDPAAEQKISLMLKRIDELEGKYATLVTPPQTPLNTPSNTTVYEEGSPEINLSVTKDPAVQTFYMPTPNPDGSFEISYSSDTFRSTISLYKFTVDSQNNAKACFEFYCDESSIRDVLNNPKTYLEPVCHETNNSFAGAKRIITINAGLALKSGDKWIVNKNDRAQIKYE